MPQLDGVERFGPFGITKDGHLMLGATGFRCLASSISKAKVELRRELMLVPREHRERYAIVELLPGDVVFRPRILDDEPGDGANALIAGGDTTPATPTIDPETVAMFERMLAELDDDAHGEHDDNVGGDD